MKNSDKNKLNIKILKTKHNVINQDISNETGLSMSHICKLISGKRPLSDINYKILRDAIINVRLKK